MNCRICKADSALMILIPNVGMARLKSPKSNLVHFT